MLRLTYDQIIVRQKELILQMEKQIEIASEVEANRIYNLLQKFMLEDKITKQNRQDQRFIHKHLPQNVTELYIYKDSLKKKLVQLMIDMGWKDHFDLECACINEGIRVSITTY